MWDMQAFGVAEWGLVLVRAIGGGWRPMGLGAGFVRDAGSNVRARTQVQLICIYNGYTRHTRT